MSVAFKPVFTTDSLPRPSSRPASRSQQDVSPSLGLVRAQLPWLPQQPWGFLVLLISCTKCSDGICALPQVSSPSSIN